MKRPLIFLALLGLVFTGGCMSTSRSNVKTADPKTEASEKVQQETSLPQAVEKPALAQPAEEVVAMSKKEIQTALKNAGYYQGEIDGVLGSRSREAIRSFQTDNGLTDDSVAGPKTQDKLRKYFNTENKS